MMVGFIMMAIIVGCLPAAGAEESDDEGKCQADSGGAQPKR